MERDTDLGGCWDYIQSYAQKERIGVAEACMTVLDRTCAAVQLILDTAEQMKLEIGTATVILEYDEANVEPKPQVAQLGRGSG